MTVNVIDRREVKQIIDVQPNGHANGHSNGHANGHGGNGHGSNGGSSDAYN